MLRRHLLPAAVGAWLALAVPAAAALPTGFVQDTLASGMARPVALTFLPDGRIFVAEQKTGQVKLFLADGTPADGPVLTVPGLEITNNEAGLLSLAIDPAWPERPYLYCHYTAATPREMRLTRFTASGDLTDSASTSITFDVGSAVHLLTGIPDVAGNHNGGSLRFGPDGALYFSLGDDENRCAAQVVDDFRGKILRLRTDLVPESGVVARADLVAVGNPFVGQGEIASLVWAIGLRNPFRMTIDAQTGSLFVGDVGQTAREELDHVEGAGLNLGWPFREGTLDFPEQPGCPDPVGIALLEPIRDYDRSFGVSVVAGFVYRRPDGASEPWPLEYEGSFFYTDFFRDDLIRLVGAGQQWSVAPTVQGQPTSSDWATGLTQAADFAVAPDGSVLYVSLVGSLLRIRYDGVGVTSEPTSFGTLRGWYRSTP